MVNRKELARRIAFRKGYNIGDVEEVLTELEDVIVEALSNGEEVKQGKLYKIQLQTIPEKKAWDGLNNRYFIREEKVVPKLKPLTRITEIKLSTTDKKGE